MATKATTATASTTRSNGASALVVCLLSAALGYCGLLHFYDGLALDTAIPVPVYMVAGIPMPNAAYEAAASSLMQANPRNGEAALYRAEALMHVGKPREDLVPLVREGLVRSPSSARGWLLLSELPAAANSFQAPRALAQSLVLAPRDYWLSQSQLEGAAVLWPRLDQDSKDWALARTRQVWEDSKLRFILRGVLSTSAGAALVERAFSNDERRALNRWIRSASLVEGTPQ